MADPTFEAEELARIMAQVAQEMRAFGEVTAYTKKKLTDAEMKAAYGIENFTDGTEKAGDAVKAMGQAAMSAGKAMLDGKKGAAAFNESIDGMTTAVTAAAAALALFFPVVGPLVAVLALATKGLASYTKAANEMADKQYKAFSQLAKSGLAASEGMSGVFRDAKKLGLSMNELDGMISVMADRSEDLAMLGGSATRGAKMLADMGEGLRDSREGFLNLGMNMADVTAGLGRYTQTMTRAGRAQSMTQDQLNAGAREYILQQDRLAKLTGMNAQKQQDILDRARENEQFNAKIRQLELQNTAESRAAADGLRKGLIMASMAGEDIAQGFMGAVNNNLANPETRKLMASSFGQIMPSINEILAGGNPTAAMQKLFGSVAQYEKSMGVQINQLQAGGEAFIKSSSAANAANLSQIDLAKMEQQIAAEQKRMMQGQGDAATTAMARMQKKQIDANESMETFINAGIIPATSAMEKFTDALNFFLEIFGFGVKSKEAKQKAEATSTAKTGLDKALEGATLLQKIGIGRTEEQKKAYDAYRAAEAEQIKQEAEDSKKRRGNLGLGEATANLSDLPSAAKGGILDGPKSGYLALLHGRELVRPLDGMPENVTQGSLDVEQTERISQYLTDINKDMLSQTRIIDKDTANIKKFSDYQENFHRRSREYMDQIIEFMDENPPEAVTGTAPGTTAGAGGGVGVLGRVLSAISAAAGAPTPQAGAGAGAGAPPRPRSAVMAPRPGAGTPEVTEPTMGEAKPEAVMAFGGKSGSRSNFEALDNAFQSAVLRAAEEYNQLTGKKIQINSAARDPADQERIYAESVAAGRPGIGPNGMPIGKPGTSKHERGLAVDIQNYTDPQAVAAFNRQGLFQRVPNDPVHFTFEDGGVASGPRSGYNARLHGDELVLPLNNNAGNFVKLFEQMAETNKAMVGMMQEMVTAQKNSVGVQEKMLRLST